MKKLCPVTKQQTGKGSCHEGSRKERRMNRLINARRLKNHYSWWEDEKQKLFDSIIDQQPTVEAIPIEWIIKWSAEHMNQYGTIVIEELITDWRKENAL